MAVSITSIARTAALQLIPGFVRAGMSANAIISQLGGLDVSYRRVTMLADIRRFSGLLKMEAGVRSLGESAIPSKSQMVESSYSMARNYRVYGDLRVENALTGEIETRSVSFYTNTLRSKEDWSVDFIDQWQQEQYAGNYTVVDLRIRSIEHKAGARY